MSVGSPIEQIDAVDAFARTLYLRLKSTPSSSNDPALDEVALAVRQLHLALRHLRVEASDQDSALNRPDSAALHARQLETLVEDCGFQLRQLDAALATIDIYGPSRGNDEDASSRASSNARVERLGNLRAKIANEKTSIDMFLDTIQLRSPATQPAGIVDGSHSGLENIKNKVDDIANRLFSRRIADGNSSFTDDEDRLWLEFKSELEKEGFSPQVLRRHKVRSSFSIPMSRASASSARQSMMTGSCWPSHDTVVLHHDQPNRPGRCFGAALAPSTPRQELRVR